MDLFAQLVQKGNLDGSEEVVMIVRIIQAAQKIAGFWKVVSLNVEATF